MQTNVFYRVITPPGFSDLYANTAEDAKKQLQKWGECPNGTPENKAYWKKQAALCRVAKVTEIIEDVE